MLILHTAEWIQFSWRKEVLAATLVCWQIKLMPKDPTQDRLLHLSQGLFSFPCPGPFTHNSLAMEEELLPLRQPTSIWKGRKIILIF